ISPNHSTFSSKNAATAQSERSTHVKYAQATANSPKIYYLIKFPVGTIKIGAHGGSHRVSNKQK
ncbi:MAG: hypothetical protein JAY95_16380, partial [Candidatus Thiodiazotropha taylori]|nr:hypothetical protein [Candidatus Thiodiazotropha taylori]